ncbi:MAG TPA: winged helix-turn-helix domain-containing protein, partial [Candidatus Baltobacteraceae bacterium]|jgi:DNA-binding winged helix-turn-helix (wHTH) protein/Tfp pilus assembly protein PilF|nr:winged helix-turn-helix domain-containing protein [Candidatus Baltobacteraceae bacterium]
MMYRFGVFSLDDRSRQVRRGTERLQLRSKCFEALAVLVRSASSTVEKQRLLDALWPDHDADEASLTQVIYELRKSLDDSGGEMIVTVPGVGYRFTPQVQALPAHSPLERYVDSVDAYEVYAKGKFLLEKGGKAHFMQALALFESAVQQTPGYALAHLGLAQTWNALAWDIYAEPKLAYGHSRAAAFHALEMDPSLPDAHACLAEVALFFDRDRRTAAQSACAALAMNPSLHPPQHTLAWLHIALGDLDEAAKIVIRMLEMSPASLNLHVTLALIYRYRGEAKKSISLLRGLLEMEPSYMPAHYYLGNSLAVDGAFDEAIRELEQVTSFEPSVQALSSLGYVLGTSGERERAEHLLHALQRQRQTTYVSSYSLALVHVGLRQYDTAVHELRRAADERAAWILLLAVEPRFGPLRGRSDFQTLVDDLQLRRAAA